MVDSTNNNSNSNYQLIDKAQYTDMMANLRKNAGRPDRPEWESLLGEDGLLKQPYQVESGYNTGALEQMRADSLRAPGEPSAWRQLQEQQLQREAGGAAAQSQANTRMAMNQMAMKGGLRSGAGERMMGKSAQNAAQTQQGILGQRLNLDMADEQNRMQGLGALNQAEIAAAGNEQGIQKYNIDRALTDTTQKRYADLNAYNEGMRAWASEKTAAATPSGGGGKK